MVRHRTGPSAACGTRDGRSAGPAPAPGGVAPARTVGSGGPARRAPGRQPANPSPARPSPPARWSPAPGRSRPPGPVTRSGVPSPARPAASGRPPGEGALPYGARPLPAPWQRPPPHAPATPATRTDPGGGPPRPHRRRPVWIPPAPPSPPHLCRTTGRRCDPRVMPTLPSAMGARNLPGPSRPFSGPVQHRGAMCSRGGVLRYGRLADAVPPRALPEAVPRGGGRHPRRDRSRRAHVRDAVPDLSIAVPGGDPHPYAGAAGRTGDGPTPPGPGSRHQDGGFGPAGPRTFRVPGGYSVGHPPALPPTTLGGPGHLARERVAPAGRRTPAGPHGTRGRRTHRKRSPGQPSPGPRMHVAPRALGVPHGEDAGSRGRRPYLGLPGGARPGCAGAVVFGSRAGMGSHRPGGTPRPFPVGTGGPSPRGRSVRDSAIPSGTRETSRRDGFPAEKSMAARNTTIGSTT
jgi:hypothetical protein